jgi:hypothetical protein
MDEIKQYIVSDDADGLQALLSSLETVKELILLDHDDPRYPFGKEVRPAGTSGTFTAVALALPKPPSVLPSAAFLATRGCCRLSQ